MPSNKTLPMFFYTYILHSGNDTYHYIGYTVDLRRRREEYRKGKNISTKSRSQLNVIYYEACLNERDARQREKYLKSTAGRRFLAKRLRHCRAQRPGVASKVIVTGYARN